MVPNEINEGRDFPSIGRRLLCSANLVPRLAGLDSNLATTIGSRLHRMYAATINGEGYQSFLGTAIVQPPAHLR